MLHKLLVPLDGSPLAERALPYAQALAQASGAGLVLVRAALAHSFPGTDPSDVQIHAVAEADAGLAVIAGRLAEDGLQVETAVPYGEAAEAILDEIQLREADLVTMATHGRSGLGRWVYGSVADQIMRRAHVPVLLVPATCAVDWPGDRPLRILVPLDGSELAEEALGPASNLADVLGAKMLLLRVVAPRCYGLAEDYAEDYRSLEAALESGLAEARSYLEAVASRLRGAGRAVEVHEVLGPVGSMIAAEAQQQGASLIALATHGRGGLARLVMGSVATAVLHRTEVPLLLVRPAALHEPAGAGLAAMPRSEREAVSLTLSERQLELLQLGVQELLGRGQPQQGQAEELRELLARLKWSRVPADTVSRS